MTHEELKKKALSVQEVQAEYNALEPEFALIRAMLKARKEAGLTQEEVAKRMDTQKPSVARLESFNKKHSPSIKTIKKYADAVGCDLEIRLVPKQSDEAKKAL